MVELPHGDSDPRIGNGICAARIARGFRAIRSSAAIAPVPVEIDTTTDVVEVPERHDVMMSVGNFWDRTLH